LEPAVLYEHGLASPAKQGGFFLVSVLNKLTVNMTSCSEVKEEADEEDGRQENSSVEMDRTMDALKALPICLNWGKIFSLPDETHQHMVIALKHQKSSLTRSVRPSSEKMMYCLLAR